MTKNYHLIPAPIRRLSYSGVFYLIFVIGGVKAVLLRRLLSHPQALVIAIDNAQEIEELRHVYSGTHLKTFVMGAGCTTYGLHRDSSPEIQAAARATANTSTDSGFGGRLQNAKRAAEELVASVTFQGFLQSLSDEAKIRTQGVPNYAFARFYGSLAGSAFAGGRGVITKAVLPWLKRLGVPIEVRINALGPDAFAGKADRARSNSASALLSTLCDIVGSSDPTHDQVAYYLNLHQIPPYQDQETLLNDCLLKDEIAMSSSQVERHLGIVRPNWGNDHSCGHINHRQVDQMTGLDSRRDISSRTAEHFRDQLADLQAEIHADQQLVDELEWLDDSQPQERESVADIVSYARRTTLEEFLQALFKPAVRSRFRILAHTAHGAVFELERLKQDFSITPQTLPEFRQRLQLIKTFQSLLGNEADWLRTDIRALRSQREQHEGPIAGLHAKLTGRHARSQASLAHKLTVRGEAARPISDRLLLRQAELAAVERAISAVDHEWEFHTGLLTTIQNSLTRFVPTGSLTQVPNFVAVMAIDDAFDWLLKFPQMSEVDQLSGLCAAASTVNAQGLAQIVGAPNDRLDTIAKHVVHGQYAIEGPPHSSGQTVHHAKVMYSLPPMEPQNEARLATLIQEKHRGAKVTFYDTLKFGATVMRIRFQRFETVHDLFDGLWAYDLYDATTDPLAPLNSVDGFAGISRFGGQVDGNRIVFPKTTDADDSPTQFSY